MSLLAYLLRALRVHQWVKNVLVLFPVLLHGRFTDWNQWVAGIIAAERLGVECRETIYVGDRPEVDGVAATRAGMASAILRKSQGHDFVQVPSFTALRQALDPESV